MIDTFRHAKKLPRLNTISSPNVAEIPAIAVIMPRTDGSLINDIIRKMSWPLI